MALNYMWVVSTGRKPQPASERERAWVVGEIVSEIAEHGRDRDDRQATRSIAAMSPPSYPTDPHPLNPAPLSMT